MFKEVAVVFDDMVADAEAVRASSVLVSEGKGIVRLLRTLTMPNPVVAAAALLPDPGFSELYADMRLGAALDTVSVRSQLTDLGVDGAVEVLNGWGVAAGTLLSAAGRQCDITVMTGPGRGSIDPFLAHNNFSALLSASGRPVIVVPPAATFDEPPRRIVIAWSDSAHTVRAIHDALPLLRKAARVDLLAIDNGSNTTTSADEVGDGMLALLRRHDIGAQRISEAGAVGASILAHARGIGAGMIVAGGYGHARIREWALGGTTRELLFNDDIPVLFAH